MEKLYASYELDDALRRLQALAALRDDRLQEHIDSAQKKLEAISKERDLWIAKEDGALRAAKKLVEDEAYDRAATALEKIPPPLRSKEAVSLLDKAKRRRNELLSLAESIKRNVGEKKYRQVGHQIDRLLELQPGNQQVRRLAEQLSERLSRNAKQLLEANQYADALAALRGASLSSTNRELDELGQQASELHWLNTEIRTSPIATPTLLAIADRLVKASPQDQEAARLRGQIARRAKELPADSRSAAPHWFARANSQRGYSVDWLGGLRSITYGPQIGATLAAHPGAFFTAIGLALQGIGQARVQTNLAPSEKGGLLGRLSFGRKKNRSEQVWGLDVGNLALKAVRLKLDSHLADSPPVFEAVDHIAHETPLHRATSEQQRNSLIQETLKKFAEKHGAEHRLCVSLPASQLLVRFVQLPPAASKVEMAMLEREVGHQTPLPLDEITWSHQQLREDETTGAAATRSVMILAAKKCVLESFIANFAKAGLTVNMLQGDSLALHNLVVHEFFPQGGDENSAIVLADVGAVATNIVVSTPQLPWFRCLAWGGEQVNRGLAHKFNLTYGQAEMLKQQPEKARRLSDLYEVVQPAIDGLLADFQRTMRSHAQQHEEVRVRHLFGLGGGFRMHGMMKGFCNVDPIQ